MGNQNQDKFSQANATDTETTANSQADTGTQTPTNGADDMLCLMEQSDRTCCLGQWMKCLRKPAISMQYTLEKRHIPDMDDDPTGQTQVKGSNSDTMSVTGGFTIRYFDLAAGAMTLLLAGCMIKALCCVKKMM
jgi:hypothetical protein